MSTVIFDISMSLDGFMTAADVSADEPMGLDGQRLHAWATEEAMEAVPSPISTIGALITGRRTYDTSLPWWQAGGPHPPRPVFVLTHQPPDHAPANSVYRFVTDGPQAALEQARAAAEGKGIRVMGGAAVGRQFLIAGLLDELVVHIVPVLLGAGTPLFAELGDDHRRLEIHHVVDTPLATHIRYLITGR